MIFDLDPIDPAFPDPSLAETDGLLAINGDLSPQRLLNAYANGIYPMSEEGGMLFWMSPDPRMVLFPNDFRYSKSLRRTVKGGRFEVRIDTCFEAVMRSCATTPRGEDGTWISKNFIQAYTRLHQMGLAHSFETFYQGELVGGLYGISFANFFFGESMFHTMTDASKVAFARMVEFCRMHGFILIDAQQETAHLASLGAAPIPRKDFLKMLEDNIERPTLQGRWHSHTTALLIGGNQGDRKALLKKAVEQINARIGNVALASPVYETEPWGFEAEQNFLNQALIIDTELSPIEVLRTALDIEHQLGRIRQEAALLQPKAYQSRPMDIDVIFYDSAVLSSPELELPHPRMHLRRFVLQPLCDIIPDYEHPTLKRPLRQLLEDCPDTSELHRLA